MDTNRIGNRFGPQHLPQGEPTNEWGPEELGRYVCAQQGIIVSGEKLVTPAYWCLGSALLFAERCFTHGQWTKYLETLGIDRARAAKARAIRLTFDNEQAVTKMSVDDAYGRRNRKSSASRPPRKQTRRRQPALGTFFGGICKSAESLVDEAAFIDAGKARDLIPMVNEAIKGLERLRDYLTEQSKALESALASVA